ncbi:hypothetical protein [Streptomyces sp. Inha503]
MAASWASRPSARTIAPAGVDSREVIATRIVVAVAVTARRYVLPRPTTTT